MVSYNQVKASNAKIASCLPSDLVAVFVGATSGIGHYTLKQFAKHTIRPRVHFIGRSSEAGSKIAVECSKINPDGKFTFIQADTSLICNVDRVCDELKAKEKSINLLFLSTGTLDFVTETSEGLRLATSLIHHSRLRFIHQLLPELQAATSLKRVVSVFTGTKEGRLFVDNMNYSTGSFPEIRAHAASLVTAGMLHVAQQAPDVSFVHTFPGFVVTGIARDMPGMFGTVARGVGAVLGPLFYIPSEESGAHHLYFATADRYPPKETTNTSRSMVTSDEMDIARGLNGVTGSGMYSIDQKGECASPTVEQLMMGYQQDGTVDKVWQKTQDDWQRVLSDSKQEG